MQYFNIKNKIFAYCILASMACPFFAIANESYLAFSSNAYLKFDGEVVINEEFIYDFEKNSKHGLYRNIPLVYEEYEEWFGIHSISVKNKDNKPYVFEVNDPGNIVKIKIGDPKITLNGSHYYNLNYTLVNIAKEDNFKWKIIDNIREPISKLQAQVFFPIPIGINSASSTCLLTSNDTSRACEILPIIKSDLIVGYKVYLENLVNEDVVLSVNYPKGTIIIADINKNNYNSNYLKYIIIIISLIILVAIIYLIYIKRTKIFNIIQDLRRIKVSPEQYSYLTRAVSYNGNISNDDIIATLIDLSDRGYILLQQIEKAEQTDIIDYNVSIISMDLPEGAEGYLISLIKDEIYSLHDWLNNITDDDKINIINLSKSEIINVKIMKSDEDLPKLDGFII